MHDITIQGGEIQANLDDRSLTGLLIPFNEEGRTNAGRFSVQAGSIELPTDPSVVSLNIDHDRYQPIGRATRLWETDQGIMATFSVGRTPAGDAALADTSRRALSGEFKCDIDAGRIARNGVLAAGAFPSARVLAELTSTETEVASADTEQEAIVAEQENRQRWGCPRHHRPRGWQHRGARLARPVRAGGRRGDHRGADEPRRP